MVNARLLLLMMLFLVSSTVNADAQAIGRADQAMNDVVSDFVRTIMTDTSSDLHGLVRSMMFGLAFIGLAWHVMMWAWKSVDTVDLTLYALSMILIFTLYANFNAAVSEFWSWSDGLGLAFQQQVVGNQDPLFIGNRLQEAMANFFTEDVSFWDGLNVFMGAWLFRMISGLLSIIVFLVSVWSIWGYAFMKITGLIFLPLLFLPFTRQFFEKWFELFLGFWFFNLFSKIALALYHLYFFAVINISDPVEFDPVGDRVMLWRLGLHFLVGIVFMLSVAGFASSMSSSFGGVTGRASRAAHQITSKIVKAF